MIDINIIILICLLSILIEHLQIDYKFNTISIFYAINLFALYYIYNKISIHITIRYNY
jgi:hypothetical protein